MRPERWRALRRHALGWGLVVLAAMVLLEGVLRVSSLLPGSSAVFVSDADIGYRVRPGIEIAGSVTNSGGFNDVERSPEKPPGTTRLAFVGDSFVFGVVERRDNFVSRFQELAGAEVEVLNFGIPAAGPHVYRALLAREVRAMDVDAVALVLFVGNDVAQAHPDFRTRVWFGAPREVLRRPYLVKLSAEYFYFWRLARAGFRTLRERFEARAEGEGTFSREAFLAIEEQRAEVCKIRLPAAVEESYRGLEAVLGGMAADARRQGVDLFAALAPDQFQVDAELRARLAALRGLDLGEYDLEQPQRRVAAILDGLGVPVLDLLPAFRAHGPATPLYLPRDSHWNAAGNRRAAEEIQVFYERLGIRDGRGTI